MSELYGWLAFATLWLACIAIPAVFIEMRREYRQYMKYRKAKDRWADMLRGDL
jgi:hypothetical protein